MNRYIIAYDLGTGGCKASLYNISGNCVADSFISCDTEYPHQGWHEQKPTDWWAAVVQSTKKLLQESQIQKNEVSAIGISGHSLGLVPVNKDGKLLRKSVPIWSDSRPTEKELDPFFEKISEEEWYMITGNGFPPSLYTVFKLMWLRNNEPEIFDELYSILGTKDYINYRMTGIMATDYSYASGTGVYDLKKWEYSDRLIDASGLPPSIFPTPVASTQVLGTLTDEAAKELGLHTNVKVVAGGVDNSCMALGARCFKDGRTYNSQGSSSWIAVSSSEPLLNVLSRPYVFTHVVPGLFTSATAIFSAGTSFRWLRDNICLHLKEKEGNIWENMTTLAAKAPAGSNKLLFNPSLAGGTMIDKSANIRGAFAGIDLSHKQNDIIRSVMEGVAMGLRVALDELRDLTTIEDEITAVGGGSKSEFWRQIYADVYNVNIVKTNIDEQAAALGAAALAAVGTGIWKDFSIIDEIHVTESVNIPNEKDNQTYEKLLPVYKTFSNHLSEIGDLMSKI
ncbi:MAG: FGGY-family carbohydrate kinase [Cytophagales bacterium]|nr:FGGY-family carbohydrate kinase [Cytophagales bacterium]